MACCSRLHLSLQHYPCRAKCLNNGDTHAAFQGQQAFLRPRHNIILQTQTAGVPVACSNKKQKVKQKRTLLTLKHAVFQGQQAVLQLTWACRQAACLQKKVKHKRTLLTLKASLHHPDWSDLNKSKSCSCMSSPCPPKRG